MLHDIVIKGARENNLKNIDLTLPKDKLIVMTGLSGSGKTSLAFDTIYAEGQRRYVDSLSSYARQFLGGVTKPDVDSIDGLSPAISIDQKTTSHNPRSTVATVTEIYDYLRLLYARIGHPYCPTHHVPIQSQTIPQMINNIFQKPEGTKIIILAPVIEGQKGMHEKTLTLLRKEGYTKARIDGIITDLDEEINLEKTISHTIEAVVDRLILRYNDKSRLFASLENALKLADGRCKVVFKNDEGEKEELFSEHLSCPYCNFSISKLEPRLFSFNAPYGACPRCHGLGFEEHAVESRIVDQPEISIRQGAIRYLKNLVDTENVEWQVYKAVIDHYQIDMDTPWEQLTRHQKDMIIYGTDEEIQYEINTRGNIHYEKRQFIEGLAPLLERRHQETTSTFFREYYGSYLENTECPECKGKRLNAQALCVKVGGKDISEFTSFSISEAKSFLEQLELNADEQKIGNLILRELMNRFDFLINVGLEYLTLDRSAGTLSGGESQRIRLATQVGSQLTGILYVLDEPSIGLHERDNARLIETLKKMRDLGNTLIVVEHDLEIMKQCDYLVDIGPGAGIHGGQVMAVGTPDEVAQNPHSLTGAYLSGRKRIEIPTIRRGGNGRYLTIKGARENNLKNVTVSFKEGALTVITGVSGSGKSTLINDCLYKNMMKVLYKSKEKPGLIDGLEGIKDFDRIIDIDQQPIGRSPRSNPATYTGVFDDIRDVFAETLEAKARGYNKGRFSFNVHGGRCEKCNGDGVIRISMNFLPDVYIPCEECGGKRYNSETLECLYKGKSIADVLDMSIDEACEFFSNNPKVRDKIQTLVDVGLGYIKLGQPATSLSGGEAQRVKLASELNRKISDTALYILDEPTTGLATEDVKNLLKVLQRIVDQGATMIVIEHNLDVIKCADYIVDLGPDGGYKGGYIVAQGTPEEVSQVEGSYTGYYLKNILSSEKSNNHE